MWTQTPMVQLELQKRAGSMLCPTAHTCTPGCSKGFTLCSRLSNFLQSEAQ